jgi:H+/gluconate symporter-like permease
MNLLIVLGALAFLMLVAYRGYSVILFAPVAALGAVLLTDPALVAPMFSSVFMEKTVGFLKNYFPVFMLGAVFGKVIELSGFSKSIVAAVIGVLGRERNSVDCRRLRHPDVRRCIFVRGGVRSLSVRSRDVPPERHSQAAHSRHDCPRRIYLHYGFAAGFAADPEHHSNDLLQDNNLGCPVAWGDWRSVHSCYRPCLYRESPPCCPGERRGLRNQFAQRTRGIRAEKLPNAWIALLPLVVVGVANFVLTFAVPRAYGTTHEITLGTAKPIVTQVSSVAAIWAVEGALLLGILTVFAFAWRPVLARFADGSKAAVAGALLASLNTASEYGFGGVIALLPGFAAIAEALRAIPNPLVNEAISVTVLAGITGSASGGMSIALAAMSDTFIAAAEAAKIPLEVLHRVASMASGGMDTLPHNGAVITLLAVTGLTHREAYKDIFVITLTKTAAVFFVIGFYYLTGIY